jgi:hypothetical protein
VKVSHKQQAGSSQNCCVIGVKLKTTASKKMVHNFLHPATYLVELGKAILPSLRRQAESYTTGFLSNHLHPVVLPCKTYVLFQDVILYVLFKCIIIRKLFTAQGQSPIPEFFKGIFREMFNRITTSLKAFEGSLPLRVRGQPSTLNGCDAVDDYVE